MASNNVKELLRLRREQSACVRRAIDAIIARQQAIAAALRQLLFGR
jgi:hypothetical protein